MAPTSMQAARATAAAVAADYEKTCMPPSAESAAADQQALLALTEDRCGDACSANVVATVPATLLALTEHPSMRLAATALCALGAVVQQLPPKDPEALLQTGVPSARSWIAKSGLESLGRALRRPGLVAAAEGLQQDVVSVMALELMLVVTEKYSTDDQKPMLSAASHMRPAATGCLRLATTPPEGLRFSPATAAHCAAHIAVVAARENKLPGGMPLLLQHLELCRAGVEADSASCAEAAASPVAADTDASGGDAADANAGGSTAHTEDAGSSSAAVDSACSPSQWAMPLFYTLNAIVNLAPHEGITDASATATARGCISLAIQEAAADQPLPWGIDGRPFDPDGGRIANIALDRLKGAAALMVYRSLLQQLAGDLAAVSADVARAYPAHAAAGSNTAAQATPPVQKPAAQTAAALTAESAALDPCTQPAADAEEAAPPATTADPGPMAIERIISLAACAHDVNRQCLDREDLHPLLAPGCDSGRAWAAAVAGALASCHFGPEALTAYALVLPDNSLGSAYGAANTLCSTATALLRRFVTAGLEALRQDAAAHLIEVLAAHLSSSTDAVRALHEVLPCAVDGLRKVGPVLTAAITVVLRAGEGGRGSGGRKQQQGQQPRRQVPSTLLAAACTSAVTLTRDLQRPAFDDLQPEGPEQAYYAVQDGARLVARLLRAFSPLAAYIMTAGNAAAHLLSKLEMLAMSSWSHPQVATVVEALCQPLALLIRQAPEQHRMFADPGFLQRLAWPQLANQLMQQVQDQPAGKRAAVQEALSGVTQALEDSLRGSPSKWNTNHVAKASEEGFSPGLATDDEMHNNTAFEASRAAAVVTHVGTQQHRTAADADAAMAALLAEEEGRAPAAAPSKAALKRARKKAAATAAASPGPASASASATPAAAAPAPTQNSNSASSQDAAAQPAADGGPQTATANSAAAAQSSMQKLHLRDSTADTGSPHTAPIPGWMMCPLTHTVLVDPVLCTGDGQSYERAAITQWLAASAASPVTGQSLASRDLLPNHALRSIIQAAQARSSRRQ